jgi:CxxC motif-containing protein (DUF1111 family)
VAEHAFSPRAAAWLALGALAGPGAAQEDAASAPVLAPAPSDGRLGGDAATVHDAGSNAFGFPAPALTVEERRAFAVGNAFFKDNWVTAPASTAGRDGLGPLFNARSCSGCHLRDGRARPPEAGEDGPPGLVLRLGVPGEPGGAADRPHPVYGEQLQDRAIDGFEPEGRVGIETRIVRGAYADGETYELVAPRYAVLDPAYGALGDDVVIGPRIATQLVGLGLLEAIPTAAILARADPDDADGDGVSGRAHLVPSLVSGERELGRFGWKATQPSVLEQTASAFAFDIGITSAWHLEELPTASQAEGRDVISGGDPEIDAHKLERVAFYTRVLAVPAQRTPDDPRVRAGEALFARLGCVTCHVPAWTTGADAVLPAFAGQTIRPYTDLLLHDLGPGLADGKRDGDAGGAEWRTPPLWGIGLFRAVSGHTRYLHDGRARDLAEAILWHGGEAERSREAFRGLEREEREALLAFLGSL